MEKSDKCTENSFECHLYFDIMLGCIKEMDTEIKKNPDTWLNYIWDIKEDENQLYFLMGTQENLFLSKYSKSTGFYQHSKLKFAEQASNTLIIKKALLYNCRKKEKPEMRLIILHKDNTIAIREITGKLIRCLKYCDEDIINLYTNSGEKSRGVIAILSGPQAKIIYFSNKFLCTAKLDENRPYRIEFEGVTRLQEVIIRKISKKESKVIGLAVNPNLFTLNVILKEHFKSGGFSLAGIFSWTKKPPPEETEKNRSFVRLSVLKKVHLEYEQPRSLRIDKAGDLALVSEEKGRVFLVDLSLFIVVRMWKGYRDCWMSFFVVTTASNRTIEYAIIYSYVRGLLEIFQLRHGIKVYSKYIGNGIRLFDCPKPLIISKEKKIYIFSIQNEAEISEENLSDLYVKKFLTPKQWPTVLFEMS